MEGEEIMEPYRKGEKQNKYLDKKTFMQQYVLNRSTANENGLHGDAAANEAEKAYEEIEEACKGDK